MFARIVLLWIAVTANVTGSGAIRTCRDVSNLYLIENQLVEIIECEEKCLNIFPCRNLSVVNPPQFDPARVLAQQSYHHNITELDVDNIVWPIWPEGDYSEVYFDGTTPKGSFGACTTLEILGLFNVNLTLVSPDWLENCLQLKKLLLRHTNTLQAQAILETTPPLQKLEILDIDNLEDIIIYQLFTNASVHRDSLREVSLWKFKSDNNRSADVSAALTWQLSLLSNLQTLEIINFLQFDMCAYSKGSPVLFRSLERLSLVRTGTLTTCFRHAIFAPKLKYLEMRPRTYNEHFHLRFRELYSSTTLTHNLTIDVYSHVNLQFTQEDYMALSSKGVVTIMSKKSTVTSCACHESIWLARALTEGLVVVNGTLTCADGQQFTTTKCARVRCDRVQCGNQCACCRAEPEYGARGGVWADCRGAGLSSLRVPLLDAPHLTELLAPNNSISSLPTPLPDTLQFADLSNNRIGSFDAVDALLAQRSRRVRLAGNPLVQTLCSNISACDNRPLLDALRYQQVDDADHITCGDEIGTLAKLPNRCLAKATEKREKKKALADQQEAARLKNREPLMIGALCASVGMTVTLAAGFYYRRTLQMLLVTHGWCLCLRASEQDDKCCYDVFLSFCHQDAELVLQELLPTLDKEYTVCLHLRDWRPGGMIPALIQEAVEQSRRTLVVLSENFVKSLWGLMEFETAFAHCLSERRMRLVVVMLGEVQASELPPLMRNYVRLHSVLPWGDPWFWRKLRFALPPPRPATPEPSLVEGVLQLEAAPEPLRSCSQAVPGAASSAPNIDDDPVSLQNTTQE